MLSICDSPQRSVNRANAIAAVRQLLLAVGEDPDRPELARTPQRVADMFADLFSGIGVDPATALGTPLDNLSTDEIGNLVALTGIRFTSVCEHHLLPFMGTADVFYAPDQRIAGLSRIAAVVESAARRPQLQERFGMDIAQAVMATLQPHGVMVRVEATHGCVAHAAPNAAGSRAVTIGRLGDISEVALQLALRETR
ncbi:GTP cyclohydrolase [Microbacterium sp. CH12i]|uniref:GTP cyclohydrolase I n=1 Tax=Microbacterium sp. CH12i TaxID=1479651 RepID=UPI000460E74C|nr:GTP cyclohydrolase I [Microbacterium sp. CH12i]KDA05309.1 GTP cyclohydrolase [Microbacterium sp. CH12i]